MDTQTKATQAEISPNLAVDLLKEGNERFVKNEVFQRDLHQQVKDTATGQYPFASILSCIDSRIPTEVIFDQGIGDIFNARVAGNFINEDILGSLEFACMLAGSKTIVVMGHTSCGAVKGACDKAELGNLTQMLGKIQPAVDSTTTEPGEARDSSNIDFVNRVAVKNVHHNINLLRKMSPVLKQMENAGQISVVGAMYDVNSGVVEFLD
ncbi:MAG: carbonic anhydrase [Bacteroidia bacterium]|nr:carbonic anhydrase [Bacteroidia bacterium]